MTATYMRQFNDLIQQPLPVSISESTAVTVRGAEIQLAGLRRSRVDTA